MKQMLGMLILAMLALFTVGCEQLDGPEPPPPPEFPPYVLELGNSLPAQAGKMDVEVYCKYEDEAVIPIHLLTTSLPIMRRPAEVWEEYEESGLTFLPERVYKAAGYDSYPNDIDFSYTYQWVTISTQKEPGDDKGIMRLSWEENPSEFPRSIYIYLGDTAKCELELVQNGKATDK